ncbi:hypothetical protein EYF80_032588 [Liparis tanakae]|uniref:Secreted protein n=1 Tax=Liparis tanakae TaxID=230148 RepID=A0A4Z2GU83_9TELE|nr:hypothetical protein EYF80_032588 [Liparis tanakae]
MLSRTSRTVCLSSTISVLALPSFISTFTTNCPENAAPVTLSISLSPSWLRLSLLSSLAHTASHFLSSETHRHLRAAEEFHGNRGRPGAAISCRKPRGDSETLSRDGSGVLDRRDGSSVPDLSGK